MIVFTDSTITNNCSEDSSNAAYILESLKIVAQNEKTFFTIFHKKTMNDLNDKNMTVSLWKAFFIDKWWQRNPYSIRI